MILQLVVVLLLMSPKPSSPIINIHRTTSNKGVTVNPMCVEQLLNNNCQTAIDREPYEMGSRHGADVLDSFPRSSAMIYSLLSSCLVGMTGIFPLLMIPTADQVRKKDSKTLNRLLSFAVGGLLGDVFLHLLPESWNALSKNHELFHYEASKNGAWVLFGLISFCLLEKCFPDDKEEEIEHVLNTEPEIPQENGVGIHQNCNHNNNKSTQNGHKNFNSVANGDALRNQNSKPIEPLPEKVKMSGYLNLLANCIDNFTHGLAIGGSYLVSRWVGVLTTAAILLHEIPHEIGDFAILLRAGFDRWKAAKYQLMTASGGIFGALFAYVVESDETGGHVAWILSFTSGGFIYIALCSVIPDLMKEATTLKETLIQMVLMWSAIAIMGIVGLIE